MQQHHKITAENRIDKNKIRSLNLQELVALCEILADKNEGRISTSKTNQEQSCFDFAFRGQISIETALVDPRGLWFDAKSDPTTPYTFEEVIENMKKYGVSIVTDEQLAECENFPGIKIAAYIDTAQSPDHMYIILPGGYTFETSTEEKDIYCNAPDRPLVKRFPSQQTKEMQVDRIMRSHIAALHSMAEKNIDSAVVTYEEIKDRVASLTQTPQEIKRSNVFG
jgi:hypothetical protein